MRRMRYGIIGLLVVMLFLALPFLAYAEQGLSTVRATQLEAFVGQKSGKGHENITLTKQSSLSMVLEWLEGFMEEECGYVKSYLTDALELLEMDNQYPNLVADASGLRNDIEALFYQNTQSWTTLNRYYCQLNFNSDRILFLIEFLENAQISPEYRTELMAELNTLQSESETMVMELANMQQTYEAQTASLQTNMLQSAEIEAVRNAYMPLLRQEAQALYAAENGFESGGNETEITVLSTKEIGVRVTPKEEGVKVLMWRYTDGSVGNAKMALTDKDGLAVFPIADFRPDSSNKVAVSIAIQQDGKRTRRIEKLYMEGAQCAWLGIEKDDGQPYFQLLCFNGKDIMTEKNEVYTSSRNRQTHQIHFLLDTKGQQCVVTMKQGKTTHASMTVGANDGNIHSFDDQWCRKLLPDLPIVFEVKYGNTTKTFTSMMTPRKPMVEEPEAHAAPPKFMMPTLDFTFPNSIPVVGGAKVSIPMPVNNLKIVIDVNGTFYMGYGHAKIPDTGKWQSEDLQDRVKREQKLKKSSIANKMLYSAHSLHHEATHSKERFVGSSMANFSPYVYAMLTINPKTGWAEGGLVVGINVGYSFDVSQQIMVGPIPTFLGFDMNASVGVGAEFRGGVKYPGFSDWRINASSGARVDLSIQIGVSAGVGIPRLAYARVRGSFATGITFYITANPAVDVSMRAALDLELCILFLSKTWNIVEWNYPEKAFNVQGMLVDSAMEDSYISNGDDFDTYPYLEDVLATLDQLKVDLPDGGLGLKPDKIIASNRNCASIDTNIQVVQVTEELSFAFFIAKYKPVGSSVYLTRLCWATLTGSNQSMIGIVESDVRGNDVYDYDFQASLYGPGNNRQIGISLVSGTRKNIQDIGSNPTEKERRQQETQVALQTRMYVVALHVEDRNNGKILKLTNMTQVVYSTSSLYAYRLPRITPLAQPFTIDGKTVYATVAFVQQHYMHETDIDPNISHVLQDYITQDGKLLKDRPIDDGMSDHMENYIYDFSLLDFVVRRPTVPSGSERYRYTTPTIIQTGDGKGKHRVLVDVDIYAKVRPVIKEAYASFTPIKNLYNEGQESRIEGAFLIEKGAQAVNGTVNTLSAIWVKGGNNCSPKDVKITYKNYGIPISADGLEMTSVFIGGIKPHQQIYAYWPQSVESDDKDKRRYEIQAVLVDPDKELVTPAFTMLELDEKPVRVYIKTTFANKKPIAYYVTVSKEGSYEQINLYAAEFSYKTALSLLSVLPEYPVIGAGDPLTLMASFKNSGNLVINKILLTLYANDKPFATVTMDDLVPNNNNVTMLAQDGVTVDARYGSDAVYRVPGVYDSLNPSSVQTVSGLVNDEGQLVTEAPQTELLKGMLPGYTQVFRIQLNTTPSTWSGNTKIKVEVSQINASMSLAGEDAPVSYTFDVKDGKAYQVTQQVAGGAPELLTDLAAYAYASPIDEKGNTLDSVTLDLDYNDQSIDAAVQHIDGVPYAIISLNNYGISDFAPDGQAMITSSIDGKVVYQHTFTKPLNDQYGYMLKIPLAELTGGNPYEELQLTLSTPTGDLQNREFAAVDNVAKLSAAAYFTITAPESLIRYENEEAVFQVSVAGEGGPFTYQWQMRYPNGTWVNLEGETSDTLTLKSVQLKDNGNAFWCVVYDANGNGKMSGVADLTVLRKEDPPPTGDEWPWVPVGMVTLLAIAALAGYLVWCKKNNRGNKSES